jgi:isopenicillin-N epimerase
MFTTIDWSATRKMVPQVPGKTNFNAGTLSPTPLPVLEAVARLRECQAAAPSDFHWRQLPPLLTAARERLAGYLHCDPLDLLLLPNVTYAVNILTASPRLVADGPGEVLTTDHEYGAMVFCWKRFAQRCGLRVRQLKLPHTAEDPSAIVDAFVGAVTPETRVVFFSHCMPTTGLVLPAEAIVRAVRQRTDALIVIDGAHAPGMIPVDITRIGADFYGANCHKWIMAPSGSGFLHVSRPMRDRIEPLVTSWGWEWDRSRAGAGDEDSGWGGSFWQREMEFHGTLDRCPQMAIPDALDFRDRVLGGDESIRARTRVLVEYTRDRLSKCGLVPATPSNEELSGCILAFDYPCKDIFAMTHRMWNEHGIECPFTTGGGRTFLRVSCAWFNTEDQIDQLSKAVESLKSSSS